MTAPGPRLRRCVVVGGSGAVGKMFLQLLRATADELCAVDTNTPRTGAADEATSWLTADVTALAPGGEAARAIAAANLVLLAVPEPVALAAAGPITALMRPGAVLVDTLSVKSRLIAELADCPDGTEQVSINPMFAPSLGIAGRTVAAVVLREGPGVTAFLNLIEAWGGQLLRLGPDQHDRITAVTQALTHATVLGFGFALCEAPVDIGQLTAAAPPPHATLLSLLARMAGGVPEVYWDIQSANPHAAQARDSLATALRQLADLVADGQQQDLAAAFDRIRDFLDPELAHYQTRCERVFAALQDTPTQSDGPDPSDS
ncbi:prephenate dehydrogenase/arogenate dehydrogenase family protein [Streptomyces sp. JUS-F4]|uniref:prephenate dehydrogenase dimerization domain-containing protein n=1 Tax=Streptomyces sp. JUS-F4 TaxID=2951988 RepID=UPI0026667EC9|nr:prephenate dehydrogenase dimerization domain-containing protein [Streptomyces sp. JUS-F4]WKN18645.1 prephenate dehydrogenase/arogenate dehydrogenase family protein [Streptomyces sp. JUS-F4]